MTSPLTSQDRAAFYSAAMLGLHALDARERTPRRFGADADARWTQFAGALGAGDRIDMLLRDAAGTWGAAFSPSECFGFFGLADEEPFGPDWGGIDDHAANKLLAGPPGSPTVDSVASALDVKAANVVVPTLSPSTKFVIAGGAALVAVARAFSENRALSWTHQVVAIADKSAFRQLAGLVAVLLGARGRTVIVRPSRDAANAVRAAGFAHFDATIISPDAETEAAEVAHYIGGR